MCMFCRQLHFEVKIKSSFNNLQTINRGEKKSPLANRQHIVKETENLVFIEKTRSFIPNNEFDKNDNHIARKKQKHANKIKKK